MNQDNIYDDALPRLAEGIRKATRIVAKTIGPKGSNVEIESKLYPGHQITNDGATVIKNIVLADPIEKIGLSHLQEAADRSNNNSGDGSTTTAVLLNAILEEGINMARGCRLCDKCKFFTSIEGWICRDNKCACHSIPVSALEIKESLDSCLPLIVKSIYDQTRQITVDDIPAVAEIAGENKLLAATLGDIYKNIGKYGIIHLEGSGTYETSYQLINGVRFGGTGFLSPYMATDGKKATYHKPAILVTKNKISNFKDIDPILQALITRGTKDLVIFTDDMDSNVARALIELQKNEKRSINILIIKAPVLWKTYIFEDFAKITGATIIEDTSGTLLGMKFNLYWLGTCDTIIVDKEETTVIGIADITDHIKDLEADGSTDAKLRLSWLTTKTAILKLGAKSETELSYLLLKAEDAIHSSRLALKNGIVAGGAVALFNAAKSLPDTTGGKILQVALKAPIRQIFDNSASTGVGEMSFSELEEHLNTNPLLGYNAKMDSIEENMFDAGIVDASSIVLGAIRNALGIASTLLTTSSVITLPPPTAEEMMNRAVMRNVGF